MKSAHSVSDSQHKGKGVVNKNGGRDPNAGTGENFVEPETLCARLLLENGGPCPCFGA